MVAVVLRLQRGVGCNATRRLGVQRSQRTLQHPVPVMRSHVVVHNDAKSRRGRTHKDHLAILQHRVSKLPSISSAQRHARRSHISPALAPPRSTFPSPVPPRPGFILPTAHLDGALRHGIVGTVGIIGIARIVRCVADLRSNPSQRRCQDNPLFPTTRAPTLPLRTPRALSPPCRRRRRCRCRSSHPHPTLHPPPCPSSSPSRPHSHPLSTLRRPGLGGPYSPHSGLDSGFCSRSSDPRCHHPSRWKAQADPTPLRATKWIWRCANRAESARLLHP